MSFANVLSEVPVNDLARWVVIGNSGVGKSHFAARIGALLQLPVCDLDLVHWRANGRKRDEAEAYSCIYATASGPRWVIEGVYGWLVEPALIRASALVWLDLHWDVCSDGLMQRGLRRGMTAADQEALRAWAQAYWTRTSSSSFSGHEQLYLAYAGAKERLRTRAQVDAFAPADLVPGLGTD